ncbi:DoxX-like family protein [Eikenella sp. S3360]|uniref:DoxX-like family protein n=1 Tax=Eikenella glucosivorans TaxID=2766967 RepID=A0ABS0ND45_9NEIS|nr:DoxX-like family protein [Eikenella glucosivorans]MBH5330227.1 DoxX-like family protein [Eikenella glucosivorans]
MKNVPQKPSVPAYLPYSLGVLWLWSGIQPLCCAAGESLALLRRVGLPEGWLWPVFAGAALLDVCFGLLCFGYGGLGRAWRARLWLAQLAAVAGYSLIVALRLPEMWAHPFAPLVKNVPVLAVLWMLIKEEKGQAAAE